MSIHKTTRCPSHQKLVDNMGGEEYDLVQAVDGPLARLSEWGKQLAHYPDGCPATWRAHYSLSYKGYSISNVYGGHDGAVLREIALRLNEEN